LIEFCFSNAAVNSVIHGGLHAYQDYVLKSIHKPQGDEETLFKWQRNERGYLDYKPRYFSKTKEEERRKPRFLIIL
jgi:hypothetical protein